MRRLRVPCTPRSSERRCARSRQQNGDDGGRTAHREPRGERYPPLEMSRTLGEARSVGRRGRRGHGTADHMVLVGLALALGSHALLISLLLIFLLHLFEVGESLFQRPTLAKYHVWCGPLPRAPRLLVARAWAGSRYLRREAGTVDLARSAVCRRRASQQSERTTEELGGRGHFVEPETPCQLALTSATTASQSLVVRDATAVTAML